MRPFGGNEQRCVNALSQGEQQRQLTTRWNGLKVNHPLPPAPSPAIHRNRRRRWFACRAPNKDPPEPSPNAKISAHAYPENGPHSRCISASVDHLHKHPEIQLITLRPTLLPNTSAKASTEAASFKI